MTQDNPPERTRSLLILVIWGAGLGAAAQFAKISVIYDRMAAIYGAAGGAGIGLMVSVVGIVGLLFGTTAGLLAERIGYRRVFVGGMALGAVLSACEALLPPWPLMMAARALEGFSQLAVVVVAPVMIAQVAQPRHQGLGMSLWATFFGVSFALTAFAAPPLVAAFGPPGLFLAHAGWMAVFTFLLALMLPADPPGAQAPRLRLPELVRQHGAIYGSPYIAAPAAGFIFYTLMYVALLTLLPLLVPGAQRVWVAEAMPLTSIVASLSLGVWLLRFVPAIRVVQLGFGLSALAGLGFWAFWGQAAAVLACVVLLSAGLGLVQGASMAAIPQLNAAPGDRARAAGAIAQLGNLGTTTGTPLLAALIAGQGPRAVLFFVLPLSLAGIAIHQWMAARRARQLDANQWGASAPDL
ncbi:MFS transporter [Acidimangrovimonas pyrenivorans]|uniref:Nitrate/nitrite transporter n=1 Tax=Acidimangrovimonas pyrenivorans TaxID=2030798 RepID=A0ABV7AE54_9RHOB